MESFEQRIRKIPEFISKGHLAIPLNEALVIAREADVEIKRLTDYIDIEIAAELHKFTTLNTAKGELIEFYEGYWTASERPYDEANLAALRDRIRSLENE